MPIEEDPFPRLQYDDDAEELLPLQWSDGVPVVMHDTEKACDDCCGACAPHYNDPDRTWVISWGSQPFSIKFEPDAASSGRYGLALTFSLTMSETNPPFTAHILDWVWHASGPYRYTPRAAPDGEGGFVAGEPQPVMWSFGDTGSWSLVDWPGSATQHITTQAKEVALEILELDDMTDVDINTSIGIGINYPFAANSTVYPNSGWRFRRPTFPQEDNEPPRDDTGPEGLEYQSPYTGAASAHTVGVQVGVLTDDRWGTGVSARMIKARLSGTPFSGTYNLWAGGQLEGHWNSLACPYLASVVDDTRGSLFISVPSLTVTDPFCGEYEGSNWPNAASYASSHGDLSGDFTVHSTTPIATTTGEVELFELSPSATAMAEGTVYFNAIRGADGTVTTNEVFVTGRAVHPLINQGCPRGVIITSATAPAGFIGGLGQTMPPYTHPPGNIAEFYNDDGELLSWHVLSFDGVVNHAKANYPPDNGGLYNALCLTFCYEDPVEIGPGVAG